MLTKLTLQLRARFPRLGSVYPVMGNHEGLPCDHLDVSQPGTSWMQELLAELWSPWLTPECRLG